MKANPRAKFAFTNQIGLLSTEVYKATAGLTAVAVNYRTAADALPDVQNGTADFMIIDGTFGLGQIRAGRIKPIAVTTARRLGSLPDVPTMQESGMPGYDYRLVVGRVAAERRAAGSGRQARRLVPEHHGTARNARVPGWHRGNAAAGRQRSDPCPSTDGNREVGEGGEASRHRAAIARSFAVWR